MGVKIIVCELRIQVGFGQNNQTYPSAGIVLSKVLMQGKLFQRHAHFLYCSVLSLGGKVNTRLMSQPEMESIFTKIIYEIFWS